MSSNEKTSDDSLCGNIEQIEIFHSENTYRARSWSKEHATRYVFTVGGRRFEASHFRHFLAEQSIKRVIELSISSGCEVRCNHCASGAIRRVHVLSNKELVDLVRWIAKDQMIDLRDRFLVTFSGIGEGSLHSHVTIEAAKEIYKEYTNAYFVFTTVGIRPDFVAAISALAEYCPVHCLQVTYLHHDNDRLKTIMPLADALRFDFELLVCALKESSRLRYRINYVAIRGLNDNPDCIETLCSRLRSISDRIVFRVSRYNETLTGNSHGVCRADDAFLDEAVERFRSQGFDAYVFASQHNDRMNCGQLLVERDDEPRQTHLRII